MSKELIETFFSTPIYITEKSEWVSDTNKFCQPYLDESHSSHQSEVERLVSIFSWFFSLSLFPSAPKTFIPLSAGGL